MKLLSLLQGIRVLETTASMDLELTGVSYDSRTTEPGNLYVAVKGYATDGHKYIPGAVEKGAAAVICQEKPEADIPYILVEDSRLALAQLGCNWFDHPSEKMKVIGITGTNGKTTVTYLLKTVLEQCVGAKVGLIGTICNMVGDEVLETERTTPESFEVQKLLRRMADAGCTHVVMETSSHALYLNRLHGIRFAVGVFTNLTEDHLDFHETMENYRKAKEILFQNCDACVFNLDDPAAAPMMETATCPCIPCSLGKNEADLCAKNLKLRADHVEFDAVIGNEISRFRLNIPGRFSAYNAMSVVGAAKALGIPLAAIAESLRSAKGVKGRVEVVPTPGKDYTILIDYAHTPDGLENVLTSVQDYCQGRVIAVFGCGGDRDPFKRPIMGKIGVDKADYVVFTSDNPRTEDPHEILRQVVAGAEKTKTPYEVIENRRAAIRWAMDHARKDDIIVLAGKGHETYQIIGKEYTHLDEREVVAAHLEGKTEEN